MIERCHNCLHKIVSPTARPCRSCDLWGEEPTLWEPVTPLVDEAVAMKLGTTIHEYAERLALQAETIRKYQEREELSAKQALDQARMLSGKDMDIKHCENIIKSKADKINARDQTIIELKARNATQYDTIGAQDEQLAHQDKAIVRQIENLRQHETRALRDRQAIKNLNTQIDTACKCIGEQRVKNEELEAQLQLAGEHSEQQKSIIAAKVGNINTLQELIEKIKSRRPKNFIPPVYPGIDFSARAENEIEELRVEVADYKKLNQDKVAIIDEQQETVSNQRDKIQAQGIKLHKAKNEIFGLKRRIEDHWLFCNKTDPNKPTVFPEIKVDTEETYAQWTERASGMLKDVLEDLGVKRTESILQEAERLTGGDRQGDYGSPKKAWGQVTEVWTALLRSKLLPGTSITAAEGSLMMAALKICRELNKPKRDNRVDIAGYANVNEMIEADEASEEDKS